MVEPADVSGPVPAHCAVGWSCASTVSQPVMEPFGVAHSVNSLPVDTVGSAQGLSGAPAGARGLEPHPEVSNALIPMGGWCGPRPTPATTTVRLRRNDQRSEA